MTVTALFDDRGALHAGWAATPQWDYQPDAIGRRLRRKEWDFYGVTTRDHYVAIVVAHAGVIGLAAIQWIDLAARTRVIERVALVPLGRGLDMPASSERGDLRFERHGARVAITHTGGGARHVRVDWRNIIEIELALAPAQGIAVVAPLGGRGFYYNHKIPAMLARGSITHGGATVRLDGFATLDWGRGVWPYRTSWRWAAAQGRLADGRRVGFTLGDVSADAGAAREDMIVVDGVLTKLAPVRIDLDRRDAMRPWRITGERVDLTLAPRFDNGRRVPLGIASTHLRQAIGTYRGTIAGVAIDALPGWAEDLRARW
jgi:hypothetical protein